MWSVQGIVLDSTATVNRLCFNTSVYLDNLKKKNKSCIYFYSKYMYVFSLNFRRTCGDTETSLKMMPRSLDTPGKAFQRQTPTKKPMIKTNTRQTQVESRKIFSFLFKLLFTYMIIYIYFLQLTYDVQERNAVK